MGKLLKTSFRILFMVCFGMLLGSVATQQVAEMYSVPSFEEITDKSNNSEHLLISNQKKIVEKSRQSAVRVLSLSMDTGAIASSSGTYMRLKDNYFVITTNHGIAGDCDTTKILVDDQLYDCFKFIETNDTTDYAVIQIPKIEDRQPIKIPRDIASSKRDWIDALSIMSKTYYTGFPNNIGPLTIGGQIMGHSPGDHIYINSYAWSGSSGSGVFSQRGDYIGYVLAIDVGTGITGPEVLENVVLVVPAYRINWSHVFNAAPIIPEREDTATYNDTNSED
jgi:hypothetical protein